MEYIDMNGELRKEYCNDGTIAVHFDFLKEAHGTLKVSRDDEPILNDILQMLKSREDRITLMDETIREVDKALRIGTNDLSPNCGEVYLDSVGKDFTPIEGDGETTHNLLVDEIKRLRQEVEYLKRAPKTTRRRRAA